MRPVLFFALTTTALAQPVTFLAPKTIEAGPGCCVIATGDFNGDGKPDVMAGFADGHVSLFAGDGKGGFAPPTLFTAIGGPIVWITAMDMNRDGFLDLVIANPKATYVFLGSGNGKFQSTGAGTPSSPLIVADVNGDHVPDLIQFGAACSKRQVFLGKGDGTFFDPLPCFGDAIQYQHAIPAEFHADGKIGFVLGGHRSYGYFSILFGDGAGSFFENFFEIDGVDEDIGSLGVGDFNGDGRLDVVTANYRTLGLAFQNAKGLFADEDATRIKLPVSGNAGHGLANGLFVQDMNNDGKLDIIWGSYLLLGNGDGTFQTDRFLRNLTDHPIIQAVVDLNGDGLLDLICLDADPYFLFPKATKFSVLMNIGPTANKAQLAYSAANGAAMVTPNSIASISGAGLTKQTATAPGPNLPTQLGGISLQVRDSNNNIHLAPLFFVSPTQINFLVPPDLPAGFITLAVQDGITPAQEFANATGLVSLSPGFFVNNGVPAATAVRRLSPGTIEPVSLSTPLDLTKGPIFLTLNGTGFRESQRQGITFCQAAGQTAEILSINPHPDTPGMDQLTLLLPATLPHGPNTIQCDFPGPGDFYPYSTRLNANPVQITIQ